MEESERDRLHRAANAAFRIANEAFEKNPPPGSAEWHEWQRLWNAALKAKDDYIRGTEELPPIPVGPDAPPSS